MCSSDLAVLRPELLVRLGEDVLDGSGGAGLDLLPPHLRKGSDTPRAFAEARTRYQLGSKFTPLFEVT